jgi:2,3-bisphosphoglycerate-dependent phosphoglycerate mutase
MTHLTLVRHGQSDWNEKNLFTGWENPDLTEQGLREAKETGQALKRHGTKLFIPFHLCIRQGN